MCISRECKRPPWPFIDHTFSRLSPPADVAELSNLVEMVVSVFQQCCSDSLKDKWAKTALHVSGDRHMYMYCIYNKHSMKYMYNAITQYNGRQCLTLYIVHVRWTNTNIVCNTCTQLSVNSTVLHVL